jgi:hypothetical protein
MHETIPQPVPPAEDPRLEVARLVLAELPPIDTVTLPYAWLGRLRTALADLVAIASPGGLDNGQREVLGSALADAIEFRTPAGFCADCEACGEWPLPAGLCPDHEADVTLSEAYLHLARELGTEVDL